MPVVFAAHQDRKVRMYDMRSGACSLSLCVDGGSWDAAYFIGWRRLSSHECVCCLLVAAAECIGTMMAHQDAVSSVSIDASGLYLATGGADVLLADAYRACSGNN